MNRKAVLLIGAWWAVLAARHVAGRIGRIASALPTVFAPAEVRAAIERGGGVLPADGSEFARYRSAFESFPVPPGFDRDASGTVVVLLIGSALAAGAVLGTGWAGRRIGWRAASAADRAGMLLITGAILLSIAQSVVARSAWSNWDAWAVWDLKTKAVLRDGWLPRAFLADPAYAFSHPEYPLLWPWAQAAVARAAGAFDTRLLRGLAVIPAAAMPFVISGLLPAAGMTHGRWLAAGVIALLPKVLDHASNGYVDWPLATVEALALLLALRCARGAAPGWAVGLAAGAAANLKQEGLVFGLGLLGGMALHGVVRRQRRRDLVLAGAAWLALALPWQAYRVHLGIAPADFGLPLGRAVAEVPTRTMLFFRALLLEAFGAGPNGTSVLDWWTHLSGSWGLFWFAAAILLGSGWRRLREPRFRIPLLVLAVQVAAALGAYATTIRDPGWLLATSLDRLMLQWIPAVTVLAVGAGGNRVFNGGEGR